LVQGESAQVSHQETDGDDEIRKKFANVGTAGKKKSLAVFEVTRKNEITKERDPAETLHHLIEFGGEHRGIWEKYRLIAKVNVL